MVILRLIEIRMLFVGQDSNVQKSAVQDFGEFSSNHKANPHQSSMRFTSSLTLFRAFMVRTPNDLDVSGVISRDCYLAWLRSKQSTCCGDLARKYRRALTNHVSGSVNFVSSPFVVHKLTLQRMGDYHLIQRKRPLF